MLWVIRKTSWEEITLSLVKIGKKACLNIFCKNWRRSLLPKERCVILCSFGSAWGQLKKPFLMRDALSGWQEQRRKFFDALNFEKKNSGKHCAHSHTCKQGIRGPGASRGSLREYAPPAGRASDCSVWTLGSCSWLSVPLDLLVPLPLQSCFSAAVASSLGLTTSQPLT